MWVSGASRWLSDDGKISLSHSFALFFTEENKKTGATSRGRSHTSTQPQSMFGVEPTVSEEDVTLTSRSTVSHVEGWQEV